MTGGRFVHTYRFAEAAVRVDSLYPDVHGLCREYRCEGDADIVARTSQADIDFERARSEAADANEGRVNAASDGYLETLAVYRKVAEAMPARGVVLVHGSCVAVDGAAYLFCAPSGTGKSTHARLWRELLGERAVMVNDDKPLVRIGGGVATAYGTPWDGKHRLSSNIAVPLQAICLLERAEANRIKRIDARQARARLLRHVYRPLDAQALALTLGLVEELHTYVDIWRLECNTDIGAARVSFAAMSGKDAP